MNKMSRVVSLFLIVLLSGVSVSASAKGGHGGGGGVTHVSGHYRSDGTYVNAHTRGTGSSFGDDSDESSYTRSEPVYQGVEKAFEPNEVKKISERYKRKALYLAKHPEIPLSQQKEAWEAEEKREDQFLAKNPQLIKGECVYLPVMSDTQINACGGDAHGEDVQNVSKSEEVHYYFFTAPSW